MVLFILSLAMLVAAPLLVGALKRLPGAARFFDAFVIVSVGGLVLLHTLPDALAEQGGYAVLAAILGVLIPVLSCHLLHRDHDHQKGSDFTLVVALIGLGVHAAFDGVALAPSPNLSSHGQTLALAVVLHRLPAGVAIWWVVSRRYGVMAASAVIGLDIAATVVGYFGAGTLAPLMGSTGLSLFQAFVGGALLHVALGHGDTAHFGGTPRGLHVASLLGAVSAVGLLLGLSDAHGSGGHGLAHHASGASSFLALALESAPAMLLAYLAAGALHVVLPRGPARWFRGGNRLTQSIRGTVVGLPLSVCSCAVMPIYQSLIGQGIPGPAAMSFLVAAPELGVASVLISFQLLGPSLGLARVLAVMLVSLAVGVTVGRLARRPADSSPGADEADGLSPRRESFASALWRGLSYGLGEVVDETLPWLLAGLGIAALLSPLLEQGNLAAVSPLVQVPLAAMIGIPLYVCASGSTPVAAILLMHGLSPGAAIAFLLTGPATNVATFGLLAKLHGRRVAAYFALAMAAAAIAVGYLINFIFAHGVTLSGVASAEVEHHSRFAWVGLYGLGLLLTVSILRQGVPRFVGQVVSLSTGQRGEECGGENHCACGHDAEAHDHSHHSHDGQPHHPDDHCR